MLRPMTPALVTLTALAEALETPFPSSVVM